MIQGQNYIPIETEIETNQKKSLQYSEQEINAPIDKFIDTLQ